ncbi:MAG: SIR2 family protein [Lachnospiraceae bacterium]
MNWIDSIKKIREAQENNQLIVFVGAGVSHNSGIPTWWELIKKIAEKIGYDKCNSCSKRKRTCPKEKCEERYEFTQDEFLRIPEYYYQTDASDKHTEYYELIRNTLSCNMESNPIDDEIFNLLPHHIITTNYDPLLEKSTNLNAQLYTVVFRDSDLLSKANERYIIKMHGDLTVPTSMVLKESDYLDYEQKHTLISTFIRALLVNHTFVFLGYSLNDYNLNLIIGWINYFRKFYGIAERPSNFLVSSQAPSEYEKIRLEDKNIYVVDLCSLPDDLVAKVSVPVSLTNPIGQKLFSYLRCISDSAIFQQYIPLSEILIEKYQVLKSYRKVSFEDLIRVCPLGRTYFASTHLVFYDKEWYEKIAAIIDKDVHEIIDAFQRAGITAIHFFEDDSIKEVPSGIDEDNNFQLYLDNDYIELFKQVQDCSDTDEKIYYYRLLGKSAVVLEEIIEVEASAIAPEDYIAILLHKMRARASTISLLNRQDAKTKELEHLFNTVPVRYHGAINYLKMLFESSARNMLHMNELVEKQEKRYEYNSNTWYSGHSYVHIWELQAYAYDYYFFFKENFLPFDYFSDVNNYLVYYLKAILCSYSPVAAVTTNDALITDRRHYPLNEIDFDMFIKYISPKSLKSLLKKYSVQFLEIDCEIDIIQKYSNLCASLIEFRNRKWIDPLYNFNIIVCLLELDNNHKKELFALFTNMFTEVVRDTPGIAIDLFECLYYLVNTISVEDADEIKGNLLDAILLEKVSAVISERYSSMLSRIVKKLSLCVKDETRNRLITNIELMEDIRQKIKTIFLFRHVLPIEQYKEFLNSNLEEINTEFLFHLIIEKIIPYSSTVMVRFVDVIEYKDKERKEIPGMCTTSDLLMTSIEECIILKLLGFDVDLTILKPYAHYSEHLQFALDPDNFDYSQIDTSNYMWQNLIYSSYYKDYFIAHKAELLTDDLKNLFDMGVETRDQQKIVYGLLLNDDELRGFV